MNELPTSRLSPTEAAEGAALGRQLDADRVCLGDYDGEDGILIRTAYAAAGVPTLYGTHPLDGLDWVNPAHFLPGGGAVPTGEPAPGVDDFWTIAVPCYDGMHLRAALFVQRRRAWTDEELRLVDAAGQRVWA
jgi:hypothetical protein